jgi:hypothetical protein
MKRLTDGVRKIDNIGVPVYYFYKGQETGKVNGIEIYSDDKAFMG